MQLTLILGDNAIDKRAAVERALRGGVLNHATVAIVDCDPHQTSPGKHYNPDYRIRLRQTRMIWQQLLRDIRAGGSQHWIVLSSAFLDTDAGLETAIPDNLVRVAERLVRKAGGCLEIVVLIDDVFSGGRLSPVQIERAAVRRHLEWTFAQHLAAQFPSHRAPHVSCFAGNHPAQNLAYLLERRSVPTVYLSHPINAYRRNPDRDDRQHLEAFRSTLTGYEITLLDPLGVDEEAVISSSFASSASHLIISDVNRWRAPATQTLLPISVDLSGAGLRIEPLPARHIGAQLKAQVPQRDFFWINQCDAVVAWRPFLDRTHHAGVLAELQYAIHLGKSVLAYSPPEDGEEHPSPFAAMVKSFKTEAELLINMSKLKRGRLS